MNKGFEMCSLGRYDIPNKQKQSNFKVDLVNSNIAVFGSAMSGKTNFLKLLINCLHKRSNIYNEQIFIKICHWFQLILIIPVKNM